ncbi:helix-turn-helix domain-containing protein [Paracoccus albus]|uniref:helix-turn-helix domain-containing protein n=1 Tax=Paracoccus albus TaxID=3017784 RepID=UPI0022F13107|nr:helix-turn-helix domain-containing protein [Paracoccus albus]WBU62102.1 helix-turn-helix domain-containing protein [Paracoccus albus]
MNDASPGSDLLTDILAVESAAGRLEGAFLADPELGRMWRAQMVLSEVCRSVGLEDIHLFEGDLVMRGFENRNTSLATARGALHGAELMRVMARPGDLRADPVAVLTRCLRAGFAEDRALDQEGQGAEWPDLVALAPGIVGEIDAAPTPVLAAIRAAAHLRMATAAQLPAAERLLFIAVDHASRLPHQRDHATTEETGVAPLLGQIRASWVLLPSMAMTAQGFRAWSPGSARGIRDLLAGLRIESGRALGQLPLLRRWRDRARQLAADQPGKSHLDDLVTLAIHQPILTGSGIAEALGVTDRTARNLVDKAVDARLLAPITGRRSYRAWAPLPMAERLRMRNPISERPRSTRPDPTEADLRVGHESDAAGQGDAMAELDAALAQADEILGRYRPVTLRE